MIYLYITPLDSRFDAVVSALREQGHRILRNPYGYPWPIGIQVEAARRDEVETVVKQVDTRALFLAKHEPFN